MKIKFSCGVIHVGDCLGVLPRMPDGFVHCCVTSPPYYGGLRDYGTGTWAGGDPDCDHVMRTAEQIVSTSSLGINGVRRPLDGPTYKAKVKKFKKVCKKCGARREDQQLGQEDTPEEYVASMVKAFHEVRRILRDDATFWLNIGDTYQKGQLLGIPWRVAFALQADGWFLRCDNIWHKPNPMPEPVESRCSKNHEYLFMFSKSRRYYYDNVAIQEKAKPASAGRYKYKFGGAKAERLKADESKGLGGSRTHMIGHRQAGETRNKRTVWTVATKSFKGSHFAVFPDALVRPCILAGTSEKGCCPECGSPWKRIVDKERQATRPGKDTKVKGTTAKTHGNRDPQRHVTRVITKGWEPTCECGRKDVAPCCVLDPFSGAGTTAKVAASKGRMFFGIELNSEYAELSRKRINKAIISRGFGL